MGNLALSYSETGRKDEAFKLREEVLTLFRKVRGPEHPDTLKAMGHLAYSYSETGRKNEALNLREEVLTLSRKVNGPEHPETLGAMGDLALSYDETGRKDEALELREEVAKAPLAPSVAAAGPPVVAGRRTSNRWSSPSKAFAKRKARKRRRQSPR